MGVTHQNPGSLAFRQSGAQSLDFIGRIAAQLEFKATPGANLALLIQGALDGINKRFQLVIVAKPADSTLGGVSALRGLDAQPDLFGIAHRIRGDVGKEAVKHQTGAFPFALELFRVNDAGSVIAQRGEGINDESFGPTACHPPPVQPFDLGQDRMDFRRHQHLDDPFRGREVVPVRNVTAVIERLQPILRGTGKARRYFDDARSTHFRMAQPDVELFRGDDHGAVKEVIQSGVGRESRLANDAPLPPMKEIGAFGVGAALKGVDVLERRPHGLR